MPANDAPESKDADWVKVSEANKAALADIDPEPSGHVPAADRDLSAAPRPIPGTVAVELPFLIHSEPTGGYWAEVPALPGCVSEGETVEEVQVNIKEAAEGWLLVNHDRETGVSAIAPAVE